MEKIKATFVKDGKWWVAYTDDIPGAMTQGKTIEEAEKNLIEVIKELESFRDNSEIIYEKIIDLKKATA
jgi:predicted RNase H-like HicB family nuclease